MNIKEKLQKALTRAEQCERVYSQLLPIMEARKDKKADKRIATALQNALTETITCADGNIYHAFTVSWLADYYGDRALAVWGNGIDYDNRISVTFPTPQKYGSMSKIQTEAEAVEDALHMVQVWRENNARSIEQLAHELTNIEKIAQDYAELLKKHEKNMQALRDKWGKAELWRGTEGKAQLSYTTRETIEELHGKPETL